MTSAESVVYLDMKEVIKAWARRLEDGNRELVSYSSSKDKIVIHYTFGGAKKFVVLSEPTDEWGSYKVVFHNSRK